MQPMPRNNSMSQRRKTKSFLFILFTCAFALFFAAGGVLTQTSTAHADDIAPNGKPIQLSSITMNNPIAGWALAKDRTAVFHTNRGSSNWKDVTPPRIILPINDLNNSITSYLFLDSSHAYIGLLQNAETKLMYTQDSGATWKAVSFDFAPLLDIGIYQIDFLNAREGWLAFDKDHGFGRYHVVLMHTTDGGATWQQLLDTTQDPAGLPVNSPKHFHFTSSSIGWMTGNEDASPDVRLYQSTDGGKTWNQNKIANIPDSPYSESFGPFTQGQSLTVPVKAGSPSFDSIIFGTYQSKDGGKTWEQQKTITTSSFQEFFLVDFNNARQGWTIGLDINGKAIIHKTINGGTSWQTISPVGIDPASEIYLDLEFANLIQGWTIVKDEAGDTHLYETINGGQRWFEIHPTVS